MAVHFRAVSLSLIALLALAQAPSDPLDFLVGDWVGEGSGEPGQGTGGSSMHWDLQHKILVRTNYAEYPQAGGRPAISHQDLMIIYADDSDKGRRAIYFDSEGHVINYAVTVSVDGNAVEFLSESRPGASRYRFTYRKTSSRALKLSFDIAPPDQPDAFKTYTDGTIRRK